jgi:tRNA1(Val) A37 N6-methylase TrmN6
MARRSVALNGLEDKIDIVIGDIKEASAYFGLASFDVITSNPPYMNHGHGLVNPGDAKAIARHEILCSLEDVIREASRLLKTGGRFYLVHRPFRLAEIINKLTAYRLEPKRMKLVHPFVEKEPNMVLIECVKGGKSMLKVEAPLIVYKEPKVYSDEIYDIYGY